MPTTTTVQRIRRAVLAAAISAVWIGGAAVAADQPAQPMIKARAQLLNAQIKNRQGEDLGEIEELVLDKTGQIKYVVISHGGFLDIGDKVVAVPWQPSQVSFDQDNVVMDISRQQLAQAPAFEKDKWPDMSGQEWEAKERTFTDSYAAKHEVNAPDTKVSFESLDTNRDGHVTKDEAQADKAISARFAKLDRNDDGKLSQWEFNAYRQPAGMAAAEPSESPSEQARASLTPEQQKQRKRIAESSEQQNVTKAANTESKASKGGGNTGKSAGQTAKDSESGSEQQRMQFGQLDKDSSGRLDRNEAKASDELDQKFSEFDRDRDGTIDRAEFSAFENAEAGSAKTGQQQHDQQPEPESGRDRSSQ